MLDKVTKYVLILRPPQWMKNLLLFFPPFFGGKFTDHGVIAAVIPSFISFSLAASCSYLVNDIMDRDFDRNHVTKKNRPIARGDVSAISAVVLAVLICFTAVVISSMVSRRYEAHVIIYLIVSFLYSIYFKNVVIADIFFISFGFIIRVLAGGAAFEVSVSGWLFLTVFMVALFLAAGKRLGELIVLSNHAESHRKSLSSYSASFLEGILWFSASASLVTYALYTLEQKSGLFYTVPLTAFGLLRYIYIVKQGKGDPTEALLQDAQVLGVGAVWVISIAMIIYR